MHRESRQKDALQYGSSANRGRCFSIFNPADTLAKLFWGSLTTLFGNSVTALFGNSVTALFGNSVTTLFLPGAIKERRGRFIPFLILLRLGLNF